MVPGPGPEIESNGRYETKFVLGNVYLTEVLLFLRDHHAHFRNLHPDRRVNNVYFDGYGLGNYQDSVQGLSSRMKSRIRWYGKNLRLAEVPVYELKMKKGLLGWKYKYPLVHFDVNAAAIKCAIQQADKTSRIPPVHLDILKRSAPVLVNSYSRKYLMSEDGNYRLTLDTDHRIYDINSMQCCQPGCITSAEPQKVIMEIKYSPERADALEAITNAFPYRLSKSSKYVDGVHRLYL